MSITAPAAASVNKTVPATTPNTTQAPTKASKVAQKTIRSASTSSTKTTTVANPNPSTKIAINKPAAQAIKPQTPVIQAAPRQAARSAADLQKDLIQFKTHIENELELLEDLKHRLALVPSNEQYVRKNWNKLNEELSSKFTNMNTLLKTGESISKELCKLPENESRPLIAILNQAITLHLEGSNRKIADILVCFQKASMKFGPGNHPILIQAFGPAKPPAPSTLAKICALVKNNPGTTALLASLAIVGRQTGADIALLSYGLPLASRFVWKIATNIAIPTAPAVGSLLSAAWAGPKAMGALMAGNKTEAITTAAIGISLVVASLFSPRF